MSRTSLTVFGDVFGSVFVTDSRVSRLSVKMVKMVKMGSDISRSAV